MDGFNDDWCEKNRTLDEAEDFPRKTGRPGNDVTIFNIFSPKNIAKKLAFLTQNKA
jgi:hypothetical protein